MSARERERACLVRQAVRGELSQRVCAERLGIGVRQFKRLSVPGARRATAGWFRVSVAGRRIGA
jgi:Trp operon repressor